MGAFADLYSRCRTCRKRKTRCDGKRPLCSTCTENGHECLGYAEGEIKKEAKESNPSQNIDVDIDDYEEDILSASRQVGNGHQALGDGSPEAHRKGSQGYFHNAPKAARETTNIKRGGLMNFPGNYRETAVFSDEEPSPMVYRDEDTSSEPIGHLDRSTSSHADGHRVPYFRYFGPTAIVPGFKQMVVSVRENRRSTGAGSSVASMFFGHDHILRTYQSSVSRISRVRRNAISSWD